MARQVEESVRKEKEEARRKREFLRKNIRDGNKTVSASRFTLILNCLYFMNSITMQYTNVIMSTQ